LEGVTVNVRKGVDTRILPGRLVRVGLVAVLEGEGVGVTVGVIVAVNVGVNVSEGSKDGVMVKDAVAG
jgi:hypothetical protein